MLFRCKVEYLPGFVQSAAKYRAFFPLIVSCFLSFYAGGYPVKILIIIFPLHTGQASNVADVMPVGVTLPAPSQIGQRCQALLARNVSGGNAALALSSISCHEPVKRSFSMCQSTILQTVKTNTTNPAKHNNSSGSFTSFAAQPTVFCSGF